MYFFENRIYGVQWDLEQSQQKLEIFGEFCVKSHLFVRLHLTVSYRKKLGEQDELLTPPIILLASSCSLAP